MGHTPRTCLIVHFVFANPYDYLSLSLLNQNMGSLNSSLSYTLMTRFATPPFLPYRFGFLFICFSSFVVTSSDTHLSSTQYCPSQLVKVSTEVNLFHSHTKEREKKKSVTGCGALKKSPDFIQIKTKHKK